MFTRYDGLPMNDAAELMRFLIESLHEELNRVKKKPP